MPSPVKITRQVVVSKDLSLLMIVITKSENYYQGFDLLNHSILTRIKQSDCITIDKNTKLIKALLSDEDARLVLTTAICSTVKEQAEFLGKSMRTVFRKL